MDVDGVVFGIAEFPRTDFEYAAQVKKVAVDLGIVPVALDVPGLLDPNRSDDERTAAIALAAAVGASLLRTTAGAPGELPPQTFVRTIAVAKAAAKAAKTVNVTLAIASTPGSLIAGLADLKHLAKDVDSAWLRYDVPFDDPDRATLGPRERVLVERVPLDATVDETIASRRGWFAIEGDGGDDAFATVGRAVRALRTVESRARLELA